MNARSKALGLPCVVQLGFAGSRRLFDSKDESRELQDRLDQQIAELLAERLKSLPAMLGLSEHHFLCGISQIAIGADTLFTQACRAAGIPQRIFLPQPLDNYLEATGSDGTPDFSDQQRLVAEELLASPHIIQERVVSDAADRHKRFEDTNREILRVSDVVVCLVRDDAVGKPGGTSDLLQLAVQRGTPTLELRVALDSGQPQFEEKLHGLDGFAPPALPDVVVELSALPTSDGGSLPNVAEFSNAVKQHVSRQARRHSSRFAWAAWMIIVTHILATVFATVVLAFNHSLDHFWTVGLLFLELIVLGIGFCVHHWLHRAHSSQLWALSRLLAEINRSVRALGEFHLYLDYLLRLRLPDDLRPLLRTLNILHLRSTRDCKNKPWQDLRDAYLRNRLTDADPKRGQIAYYSNRCSRERLWLAFANWMFVLCTGGAVLATALKLAAEAKLLSHWLPIHDLKDLLGTLAIILPVLAVGALSWSAAKDYEARVHTFGEMARFLEAQQKRFERASSAGEFQLLVEETESRLLGETAEWYSRRTFTGVA